MIDYTVRINWSNNTAGKPKVRFTLEEARDYATSLIKARNDIKYIEICKGRAIIETIR